MTFHLFRTRDGLYRCRVRGKLEGEEFTLYSSAWNLEESALLDAWRIWNSSQNIADEDRCAAV